MSVFALLMLSTTFIVVVFAVGYAASAEPPARAKCTESSFEWMLNSQRKDPCDVGASLGGTCTSAPFIIPPVNGTTSYIGPSADGATPCKCSSVYYSLLAACALCQGSAQAVTRWARYSFNCTPTVYMGTFPEPIPADTVVPHWAFLNISDSVDVFDVTRAQAVAASNLPESTGQARPTASTTPVAEPKRSTNTGAVAGGVVGGVVALGILAAAAFWVIRRRRRPNEEKIVFLDEDPTGTSSFYPGGASTIVTAHSPKLYDPSDPATYPTALPPSSMRSSSGPTVTTGSLVHQDNRAKTTYTGVPEVS